MVKMFDTEADFAFIARRAKEIKDAEEAWFATPPPQPPKEPFAHSAPDKLTGTTPDLEQEWWDDYYNGGGA